MNAASFLGPTIEKLLELTNSKNPFSSIGKQHKLLREVCLSKDHHPLLSIVLSLQSKTGKIICCGLKCLEKLISYQLMGEEDLIPKEFELYKIEQNGSYLDFWVDLVYSTHSHGDEQVKVEGLKVIVSAVAAEHSKVHGQSLKKVVVMCYSVHFSSKNSFVENIAKASLTQIARDVFRRLGSFDQNHGVEKIGVDGVYGSVWKMLGFRRNLKKEEVTKKYALEDAQTVFLMIVRNSNQMVTEDVTHERSDLLGLGTKILSLQVLYQVMELFGDVFQEYSTLLALVRLKVARESLVQNCTCSVPAVVTLSLKLFLLLFTAKSFKGTLKEEIEMFLSKIFLKLLESSNCPYEQKQKVVQVFEIICKDSAMLGEIFLNYDCDYNSNDLFQKIVIVLAKIAKGNHAMDSKKQEQEAHDSEDTQSTTTNAAAKRREERLNLQLKALQCLVAIGASLRQATDDSIETPQGRDTRRGSLEKQLSLKAEKMELDNTDMSDTATQDEHEDNFERPESSRGISVVQAFESKQRLQMERATGILKFNVKPNVGIQYLIQHNHIENTAKSVAAFLLENAAQLNKTNVGEYLGKEIAYQGGFSVQVLHEYVDQMDFTDMTFDGAIRHFLAGFRLPGEAQKIDRMMEKFAERFCLNNPNVFPSADTAFILAFSVIMLQTDLHNPSIRDDRRMTKEGFVRNNRGINAGEDLAETFLEEIFDRIAATPISLKEDEAMKVRSPPTSNIFSSSSTVDRMRREAYIAEREAMVSEAMLRNTSISITKVLDDDVPFYSVQDVQLQHIRPMFDILWAPLLACCSVLLETFSDKKRILCGLRGFSDAIHISSYYGLLAERNAFLLTLIKFTRIHHHRTFLLSQKHILGIKALLAISVAEGAMLGEAWKDILFCLAEVASLQLMGQNGGSALLVNSEDASGDNSSPAAAGNAIFMQNAMFVSENLGIFETDKVFLNSKNLPDAAIEAFVIELCFVSDSELHGITSYGGNLGKNDMVKLPRVYSLQKLIEVADMNMDIRSRIVWSSVWKVLSRHFKAIGCNSDLHVAMYAIDALRQLSVKFLDKQELKAFNFQRLFLTPFEEIITHSNFETIRELVVKCVEQMVLSKGSSIRSGWKSVMAVFCKAAQDQSQSVVLFASHAVSAMINNHFSWISSVYLDIVACLLLLATQQVSRKSALQAVRDMGKCFQNVASGMLESSDEEKKATAGRLTTDSDDDTRLWWPLLTGFARLALIDDVEVRNTSIKVFFKCLQDHVSSFTSEMWLLIFKGILLPTCDSLLHHYSLEDCEDELMIDTCCKYVLALCDLYHRCFELMPQLINSVLNVVSVGLKHTCEKIATNAIDAMCIIIWHTDIENKTRITQTIVPFLKEAIAYSIPNYRIEQKEYESASNVQSLDEFIQKKPEVPDSRPTSKAFGPNMYSSVYLQLSFKLIKPIVVSTSLEVPNTRWKLQMKTKLCIMLKLQDALLKFVSSRHKNFDPSDGLEILDSLLETITSSRTVNDDLVTRKQLLQSGFQYPKISTEDPSLPNFVSQELNGKLRYCQILEIMYIAGKSDATSLVSMIVASLDEFMLWSERRDTNDELAADQNERIDIYVPLVLYILNSLSSNSHCLVCLFFFVC